MDGLVTPESQDVSSTKVIKRYQNRKLYDTEQSSYVNLSDVYSYIENGQKVQVINNKTKEDITNTILLNALVEKGKSADKSSIVTMIELVAAYIKGGQNG